MPIAASLGNTGVGCERSAEVAICGHANSRWVIGVLLARSPSTREGGGPFSVLSDQASTLI